MKQYLSIVLRNQFNLFYRFGYTFIPKSQLVEFDGIIDNEIQESIIKQFKTITPFEYDEEYLILHLEKENTNESDFIQFEIQNIISVYPLSQQAKVSIESNIDQRIQLKDPIFEAILPIIETKIENKEVEKAILALWTICKIENPLEKYIANIGLENIFKGLKFRKYGTKANKIQKGNYWEYLVAYDRFDYFPKSTLGYFYDAGQVFAYSTGRQAFEGSQLHDFLERLNSTNPKCKLPDIIKSLETKEQLKGYVSQTTTSNIKQYIVAPLYLMLRDEIRTSEDIAQTILFKNLDYLKKFEDSFNYVVILLGAFFGFRKFYDNYYETLNLRFYKGFKEAKKQDEKVEEQKNIEDIPEGNEVNESDLKSVEQEIGTQTNIKDKEETTELKLDEKQNSDKNIEVELKESPSEIEAEKQTENSNIQQDKSNEDVSAKFSQYKKIIEQEVKPNQKVKLADIVTKIKEITGTKTLNVGIVENVAKQMDEFEIIKIGKAKGIRRSDKSTKLFDTNEFSN